MDSIIDLILTSLKNLDKPSETKLFLDRLKNGNDYEQRLLICLGIDLKANLLELNILNDIFNAIDYECLKTDMLLDSYEKEVIKLGNFVSQKHINPKDESIQLARVMKSSVYSQYFYPKTVGIYDVNPNWRDVKREIERGNLEDVNMPNNALRPRSLVWCTPLPDLEKIISECNDSMLNPANEIVNRLGLCLTASSNNEYIYLSYNKDFNNSIFQPCNLSNCWTDDSSLYLSCKTDDNFGRTRPRQGDNYNKQMKEAVHNSIDNPDDFICTVKLLGNVTEYSLDLIEFNNEAMKRYTA